MTRKVKLVANAGIFRGLAMQNMMFHQCIAELVDNAIAARPSDRGFKVDIVLLPTEANDAADVYVADNCQGMGADILERALQLGESATTTSRLNEHGYGMKNALATLSGGNGAWDLVTRAAGSTEVLRVSGPFGPEMTIEDCGSFPTGSGIPEDVSTLISVRTRLSFIQTVQGRGAPTTDLSNLRKWLCEHLGVLYRGYLEQNQDTGDSDGVIVVSLGTDRLRVLPIQVPMSKMETHYFDVELGGSPRHLTYRCGTLDEEKRDKLLYGCKTKYYYLGNQPTQGIDIRLGKRVIATRQFETIWKTPEGDRQLTRHNSYNEFTGELVIPELPRGVLTTTNCKTDFNLDDADWVKIFTGLNKQRPWKNAREKTEGELRDKWTSMLKATNPEDTVTRERVVWPTGLRIDVYRKKKDGTVIIYELKAGDGTGQHLYQLKMYWDGLVLAAEQPQEAVLLVEDFSDTLAQMAKMMNSLPSPSLPGASTPALPYSFRIERHKDRGL